MISDQKKLAVKEAAQRWHGTPFREHTEICQVGADCVHLARGVAVSAGFDLPPITNHEYPLDWAKHRSHSLVLEWVETSGKFVLLPEGTPPQPGDLLCLKLGRCSHHVALMVDDRQFLHTVVNRYAEYGLVDDPTHASLVQCVYRLREMEDSHS